MADRQRSCDRCGTVYTYRRSTSRYCGPSCRARGPATATVTTLPGTAPAGGTTTTYDAARAELAAADRLDTLMGVALLQLATRIDNSTAETGSALATLVKQLETTRTAALAHADGAADPINELRRLRDERAARAAG